MQNDIEMKQDDSIVQNQTKNRETSKEGNYSHANKSHSHTSPPTAPQIT